ncbi:hypothetical protein HPB51_016395 [Rhipicephalus microplus]|uniref:Uncharacterized protein n=1 Tax=Rhipicephalus microplus TaxID=6941 RepID=A0A9J6EAR4_RHIMP|nr:hypothetical protein HPB51_016395 [Rhipicephalus microplus]
MFNPTNAAAHACSLNSQPPEGVQARVQSQGREWTAVRGNSVGRSSCGSETSHEVDHPEEPMNVGVRGPEEEASGLFFSASTLAQHRGSYEHSTWPVYEGGNSFTCEGTGPGSASRIRANDTQGPKSGTFSGEHEAYAHDIVPPESANDRNRTTRGDDAVTNSTATSF